MARLCIFTGGTLHISIYIYVQSKSQYRRGCFRIAYILSFRKVFPFYVYLINECN